MKTKLSLLASTTLAMLAVSAPAQAGHGGWYFSLSGGANWLSDDNFVATNGPDTLTFNPDSETGWLISGAVGLSLDHAVHGLRLEVEAAYRANKVDGAWSTTTGGFNDNGLLDYDHTTVSVLANVWYDFDLGDVRPYVGGGIGWGQSEVDGTFLGGTVPKISRTDDGFAWQLGAGLNFDISPNVQLGVGYRYLDSPDVLIAAPRATNSASNEVEGQNHAAVVTLTFGM